MKPVWIIAAVLGVLVLGLSYGYWIGTVGRKRSWPGNKIKWVAGGPLIAVGMVMQILSLVSSESSGYANHSGWAAFPWMIVWASGFFAMAMSAVGAKIAMSDLEKKDNLSIR